MIPEPLSSIACCLRLVAVMLSQHLRGCRNPPPLMDQSLHAIDCMHRSTNRLIPDPSHSLIARISTMDQGSADPRSISLGKQPKLARSPLHLIQWTRDQ